MSNVKGRFGVEVLFTDSTVVDGAKSLKTIALQHATEYDFGKVAVVTGTVSTAATLVGIAPTTYRNSAGDIVSFSSVSRVAFAASGANLVKCYGDNVLLGEWHVFSRAGQIAVSEAFENASGFQVQVTGTAGTSAYTLVMYGS
jgi:hypothetical protein